MTHRWRLISDDVLRQCDVCAWAQIVHPTVSVHGDLARNVQRVLDTNALEYHPRSEWFAQIKAWQDRYPFHYEPSPVDGEFRCGSLTVEGLFKLGCFKYQHILISLKLNDVLSLVYEKFHFHSPFPFYLGIFCIIGCKNGNCTQTLLEKLTNAALIRVMGCYRCAICLLR